MQRLDLVILLSLVVEDSSFLQSHHVFRSSPHPSSDVGGKDSAHRMHLSTSPFAASKGRVGDAL